MDIDSTKLRGYRNIKVKAEKVSKEANSRINAVKDEFEDRMKDEEFQKEFRIQLREQRPEAAKQLGI